MLRRDIFDRPPVFKCTKNKVILLGDSAHAMQPNLGQGGCMAIEDAYQLAKDLSKATDSFKQPWFNVEKLLVVSQFPTLSWIAMFICDSSLANCICKGLVQFILTTTCTFLSIRIPQ